MATALTVLPPTEFGDEAGIRVISYLPMAHTAAGSPTTGCR